MLPIKYRYKNRTEPRTFEKTFTKKTCFLRLWWKKCVRFFWKSPKDKKLVKTISTSWQHQAIRFSLKGPIKPTRSFWNAGWNYPLFVKLDIVGSNLKVFLCEKNVWNRWNVFLHHFLRNGKQFLPLIWVRFFDPMFANWASAKTMPASVIFFQNSLPKWPEWSKWPDWPTWPNWPEWTKCLECTGWINWPKWPERPEGRKCSNWPRWPEWLELLKWPEWPNWPRRPGWPKWLERSELQKWPE